MRTTIHIDRSGNWDLEASWVTTATEPRHGPVPPADTGAARSYPGDQTVHAPSDFESFRQPIVDAVDRGDMGGVLEAIHPTARTIAVEHGAAFRDLVGSLPNEVWHNDPRIAAALGGSYRAVGSPRGQSSLGYFRAAEAAIVATPHVPPHCLASVLLGHGAALRTHGQLAEAREKLAHAVEIVQTGLAATMPIRIELDARWSLEHGMLDLHEGLFDSARAHLEYAQGHASVHLTRAEHIECLGAIAILDGSDGEYDRALEQAADARALADGTDLLSTGFGAPALAAELMISNERLQLERSAELEPALLTASRHNEWEPFAAVIISQLRALEGHPVVALDVLAKSTRGFAGWDSRGVGVDIGEMLRAAMLMLLDQGDEAWTILQTIRQYEHHPLCHARIVAQLRLRHGDILGADEAIRECEALGDAHSARTMVEIQLLRAAIELERGNNVVSDVSADRAFVSLARTGALAPLRRIPGASLSSIATRALERRHLPEVTRMLERIVTTTSADDGQIESLSARERLVLAQVQRGITVAVIAGELYISPNTVKTHLRRLYRKLGVSTREEAIRAARSLGLEQEITRDSPALHRDSPEEPML